MSVLASTPPGVSPGRSLPELFAPPDRTLPKMLARQAERYGPRRLVTIGGVTLTYAETAQAAAGHGAALAAAGVKPGDRVAIMCGNRAELLLTILGCGWLGAIAVPINTASRGAQLEHILGNCGARLMVIERELMSVLAPLDRARVPLQTLWLVGEGPTARRGTLCVHAVSAAATGRAAPPGRARRYLCHSLHLRNHRACQRACAARMPSISGGRSIPANFSACARTTC